MKRKITKSTTTDNIIGFLWALLVFGTFTYLIFWREASGWWYLLAGALSYTSVWHEKIEEETIN